MRRNDTIVLSLEMLGGADFAIVPAALGEFSIALSGLIEASARTIGYKPQVDLDLVDVRPGSLHFHFGPTFHFGGHDPKPPNRDWMKTTQDILAIAAAAVALLAAGAAKVSKDTSLEVVDAISREDLLSYFRGVEIAIEKMKADRATLIFQDRKPIILFDRDRNDDRDLSALLKRPLPWTIGAVFDDEVEIRAYGPTVRVDDSSAPSWIGTILHQGVTYKLLVLWERKGAVGSAFAQIEVLNPRRITLPATFDLARNEIDGVVVVKDRG